MSKILFLGFFATWFAAINPVPPFPYDLEKPNVGFDLPDEIKEVSGLSLTSDGKMLAAVNDEMGIIFLLDKKTGALVSKVEFREAGDYEGVEIVGDDAWVSKSNGTLYQVKNFMQPNPEVQSYKSFLNKENDVEGLAYDPKNNRLLIGCKGKAVNYSENAPQKAIYAFDLKTETVSEKPAFLLTLSNLEGFMKTCGDKDMDKMKEHVCDPSETDLKFSPSGIAIHPKTGYVYVTSARGNTLLVLDTKGEIVYLKRLKKSVHGQPEGICFDTDGTLFISNEGVDGSPGKIFTFHNQ